MRYKDVFKLFKPDFDNGILYNKFHRNYNSPKGAESGGLWEGQHTDYRRVFVGKTSRATHIVLWLLFYGCLPKGEIDHIDGDWLNNRIDNLRDVSRSLNQRNVKQQINNKSGRKGVCRIRNKWVAFIGYDGVSHRLGSFDSFDDAVNVRVEAEKQHGYRER